MPGPGTPPQPPITLLDEIREKLWLFTTFVFATDGERPRYSGTATCVAAGSTFYLLTAAHVWNALRGPRLAVSLDADRLLIPIDKELLEAKILSGNGRPEWGPDLALVRLPDLIAMDIQNMKVFYDLERPRPEPPPIDGCEQAILWAVAGAPAEQATFTDEEAFMQLSLFDS